jgi:predicted cupin superfamily sugar epimerase
MVTADDLIRTLNLQPHPMEGGYFRETYRSKHSHAAGSLPPGFAGPRSFKTAIYYLLTPRTFSAMHRLPGDEMFHFYLGHPVRMLQLWPDGSARTVILGSDVLGGQQPQVLVPAGVWQGCCLEPGGEFALMGTTMAPGFDYRDYETGHRDQLIAQYPKQTEMIRRLTKT